MALSQSALLELLSALDAADGVERVRLSLNRMYQELIEAEATEFIGAGPHERTDARVVQRNGHRPRTLSTTAGDLELAIPKLRGRVVLPVPARAATPGRSGVVRRRDGGLRHRHQRAQGRRPGQGTGCGHRDLQVRGVADLRRPRH